MKGAVFAANVYEKLGFSVVPNSTEPRHDIIQAVTFGKPEGVIAFCQGIQAAAPVDSFVTPEPWAMPGYDAPVIMAAGAFVQGASIELSADGPIDHAVHLALMIDQKMFHNFGKQKNSESQPCKIRKQDQSIG